MKKNLLATLLFSAAALTAAISVSAQTKAASPEKNILWVSFKGEPLASYTEMAKKQFQKAGWKFELATPERALKENHDVYFFGSLTNHCAYEYIRAWPILWEKVKAGAILVLQPANHMDPMKITNDEKLFYTVKGVRTSGRIRKTVCLPGEWLDKPLDLRKEFKNNVTSSYMYYPIPEFPAEWQTLATQPKDDEGKDQVPFLLLRPYGKGFVILMSGFHGRNETFSLGVLFENLYENREALRGKSL